MSYLKDLNSQHEVIRQRAERVVEQLHTEYTINNGILRNSIGRVTTEEIAELAAHIGIPFDQKATDEARSEEQMAVIQRHIEGRKNMTADQKREEAAERRAAFGPGQTIVDVITGEKSRT